MTSLLTSSLSPSTTATPSSLYRRIVVAPSLNRRIVVAPSLYLLLQVFSLLLVAFVSANTEIIKGQLPVVVEKNNQQEPTSDSHQETTPSFFSVDILTDEFFTSLLPSSFRQQLADGSFTFASVLSATQQHLYEHRNFLVGSALLLLFLVVSRRTLIYLYCACFFWYFAFYFL
jgi:hypothetical protein